MRVACQVRFVFKIKSGLFTLKPRGFLPGTYGINIMIVSFISSSAADNVSGTLEVQTINSGHKLILEPLILNPLFRQQSFRASTVHVLNRMTGWPKHSPWTLPLRLFDDFCVEGGKHQSTEMEPESICCAHLVFARQSAVAQPGKVPL